MVRWSVLAGCAAAVAGAAFVTGATAPSGTMKPPLPVDAKAEQPAKTVVVIGQKTGYFNMAKVMRESKRAQTGAERLNAKRVRSSANILGMRAMYLELQTALPVVADKGKRFEMERDIRLLARHVEDLDRVLNKTLNAKRVRSSANILGMRAMYLELQTSLPRVADKGKRFEMERDIRLLARHVEDLDRVLNKTLNERAAAVIVAIHDDVRAATAATARENGLVAVLAFPDATNPQEAENPAIKELRLKPPALHPFYLDPSVDYTDEIVRRMNEKFASDNDD